MNNITIMVMKDGTVISNAKGEVYDLGDFARFFVHLYVKVPANSGQTLQIQHAGSNEDGAFVDIGSTLDLATAGNDVQEFTNFLRYVRYVTSSGITTQPTLSIYLVAKES